MVYERSWAQNIKVGLKRVSVALEKERLKWCKQEEEAEILQVKAQGLGAKCRWSSGCLRCDWRKFLRY